MASRTQGLIFRVMTPAIALGMMVSGAAMFVSGVDHEPQATPTIEIGGPGIIRIPVGGRPLSVAVGGGSAWVLRQMAGEKALVRIDVISNQVGAGSIPVPPDATDVAVGAGGVWVLTSPALDGGGAGEVPGSLLRFDPITGELVALVAVGSDPRSAAAGPDGVWVGNNGDGTVVRVAAAANEVVATISVAPGIREVMAGENGVWVNVDGDPPSLYRIDPLSTQVLTNFEGLTVLNIRGTRVWALQSEPTPSLVQIDPATGAVTGDAVPISYSSVGLTTLSGAMWLSCFTGQVDGADTDADADANVFRMGPMDPATGRFTALPIAVDNRESHPVPGDGALWVASRAANAILRVDPAAVLATPSPTG